MSRASLSIPLLILVATGCSSTPRRESLTLQAGEKATVGPLVYNVVETQILTKLGDDPASVRTPQNRFFLMKISVSNSSNADVPIPGLTLVDDSGNEYPEAADGTGVPDWLGVVRRVGAAQTDEGNIVFDAPAKHYRLRLTDETDPRDLYIDVPLNFIQDQVGNIPQSSGPQLPPIAPPPGK